MSVVTSRIAIPVALAAALAFAAGCTQLSDRDRALLNQVKVTSDQAAASAAAAKASADQAADKAQQAADAAKAAEASAASAAADAKSADEKAARMFKSSLRK